MRKARYIMLGGFLGAGKTTAVGLLARRLNGRGLRVGLITNDQGGSLVDTRLLRAQGFNAEEIAGGCFCCRFNSLVEAAQKLSEGSRPDVFIAEPVGSCTDLAATVTYPLRRMYGDAFTIAPVSVLLDPLRAERVLGLQAGRNFTPKVVYIYLKQMEEADLLVINKSDLLEPARLDSLQSAISQRLPGKRILTVSSREGTNLDEWFDVLMAEEQPAGVAMRMDYAVYADGEALLGWLNATVQLNSDSEFDSNAFLQKLAEVFQAALSRSGVEVAHLKMTFSPDEGLGGVASVNLVRSDFVPELGMKLEEPAASGQLIVNLRAEADPVLLESTLRETLATAKAEFSGLVASVEHVERFRPGKPEPTHRLERG